MRKIIGFFKKELMLTVSLIAAVASFFITPPSKELLADIDWRTLGILLMMLCVLEGFKKESVLSPLVALGSGLKRMTTLTLFLVFGVFFSSMFVTNDVSLIIFVPITILIFKRGGKEKYILPVITFENIAAIRGSLLMPFGSPQNLFLYGKANVSAAHFMLHMLPLCAMSAILLVAFILFLYRKDLKESTGITTKTDFPEMAPERKPVRILYGILFAAVILTIVTRTRFWPYITVLVLLALLIFDRKVLVQTDYVLLLTFLCFFIFSASICKNPVISDFLKKSVAGHEYFWSIALSQVISNVPASIVLSIKYNEFQFSFSDVNSVNQL